MGETQVVQEIRSFRDPGGVLIRRGGRILRALNPEGSAALKAYLATSAARDAMERGEVVRSAPADAAEFPDIQADWLIEHERIPFPSYPYEWPPEMLYAAGELTLRLARQAFEEGFGIKDASPYNVLFRASEPVFVDILSFEQRNSLDSAWMVYGQFARTFLLPLLASAEFGLTPDRVLFTERDGLEPATLYRWAGFWRRWSPKFLNLVTIPHLMSGRVSAETYRPRKAGSADQAKFIFSGLLKSCERQLQRLRPGRTQSAWTGYIEGKSLYAESEQAQKDRFVAEALDRARPSNVLDVGANEGRFSILAAKSGASVVAIDSDPAVAGEIWRTASAQKLDILPLVVNLARPTPGAGWRNQECDSFLDRARGGFDMVLMLAVIHHLLVTERIPLEEILELTAELTRDYALIEFVAPEDPMFQRIVRGRETLYAHLTRERFEAAAAPRFEQVECVRIGGLHRWLYLFRRRRATI